MTRGARFGAAVLFLAGPAMIGVGAGCGGSGSSGPTPAVDAGQDGASMDRPTFPDASSGSGGSVVPGSGGQTGVGGAVATGGRTGAGTGGSTGSGGASGGGGAGGSSSGCYVVVTTLSALEAGPNARARLSGSVTNRGSRPPSWTWQVQYENSTNLPVTPVDDDPALVEFPIKFPGRYAVHAAVDTGITCRPAEPILFVRDPAPSFLFRVTPPVLAMLGIPPQEQRIEVGPVGPSSTELNLSPGATVSMLARDTTGRPIPAYVRISGAASGMTIEGHTATGPLNVLMLPLAAYDVLVVPDGPYAPKQFSTTSAQAASLEVEEGTYVTGRAVDASGTAVVGARIVFRSGVRPSTVGVTNEAGEFLLLTQPGTVSAVIAPPSSTGLPEGHVGAAPDGIRIDGTMDNVLTMTWGTVIRGPLSVNVKTIDGNGPALGARVRIESESEQPSVGTLKVENRPSSGAPQVATLNVTGSVRLDKDVDASGLASFAALPAGPYRVVVVPPASTPDAGLTTIHVNVSATGYAGTVSLARQVMLSGTLLGTNGVAGVRVIARDQSSGITAPIATAISSDTGAYTLSVDPGDATMDRVYQLVAEPPAGTALARTVLGTVPIRAAHKTAPMFTVAGGIPYTGIVRGNGRSIGGAAVQVFCLANACLDPTFAIAETVTRQDGSFTVALPVSGQTP